MPPLLPLPRLAPSPRCRATPINSLPPPPHHTSRIAANRTSTSSSSCRWTCDNLRRASLKSESRDRGAVKSSQAKKQPPMSVQAATGRPVAPWPYVEYMAQWERQVERRQLFLRSYPFSRDAAPRSRARRVVWTGARRLRRAAVTGLRRLRLCFAWAARRRPRGGRAAAFRYGRLSGRAKVTTSASVCFC